MARGWGGCGEGTGQFRNCGWASEGLGGATTVRANRAVTAVDDASKEEVSRVAELPGGRARGRGGERGGQPPFPFLGALHVQEVGDRPRFPRNEADRHVPAVDGDVTGPAGGALPGVVPCVRRVLKLVAAEEPLRLIVRALQELLVLVLLVLVLLLLLCGGGGLVLRRRLFLRELHGLELDRHPHHFGLADGHAPDRGGGGGL
ncbi:MAG: hypothetical protein BJ554DRAFT_4433, partial [Olpidium bornovanus]